jgi:hypothetical protein
MKLVTYQAGVQIAGAVGVRWGQRRDLPDPEADRFIEVVRAHLDQLKLIPLGNELLTSIGRSGRTVTIFASDPAYASKGSVTLMEQQDAANDLARMVKPFRSPDRKLLAALQKDQLKAGAFVTAKPAGLQSSAAPQLGGHRAPPPTPSPGPTIGGHRPAPETTATYYSRELTAILDRASAALSRAQVAKLVGRTPDELARMEAGKLDIDDDTYYRLAFSLYEFLTPGSGINTVIRYVVDITAFDKKKADVAPMVLGHELIHAWRMMTGRRVVPNGWEEEAMTTGIPPFTTLHFTENKLRMQCGMPLRPHYNTDPNYNSKYMAVQHFALRNAYQGCGELAQ